LITACVLLFWGVDRPAAILFLPYGIWVTFATYLNAAIWWLN
jgi:benzodiazapine receptor